MRTKITLACTECKQRNYNTTKEKKNHPDRMEIKKYCRFCNDLIKESVAVVCISAVLAALIALFDTVIQYGINFMSTLSF